VVEFELTIEPEILWNLSGCASTTPLVGAIIGTEVITFGSDY